jgi:cytoskeletal protein CcmA (bactofilin family)
MTRPTLQPTVPPSTRPAPPSGVTLFPRGVRLVGDLSAQEDLLIEGDVTGTIDMPGHAITISEEARVDARIFARDVTILGAVVGRIAATEIIDVREGATVSGELAAPAVALAEGAQMHGRVETKRVDAAVYVARYRMMRNHT